MKQEIHPDYSKAVITCSCGNAIKAGSTKSDMTVEICSACHPFYTGAEKVLDTAGRVEKFKSRFAQAATAVKPKHARKAEKKEARSEASEE